MFIKFVGIFTAVLVLFSNSFSFSYVYEKNGSKSQCELVTDNKDNEILFANTDNGPVLIPFAELLKMEVLMETEKGYSLNITYKDKSQEVVNIAPSPSHRAAPLLSIHWA